MLFEDKTQNNIMADLIASVSSDVSTQEGSLIDHSFRGAAAEFERAYMELGMIDQNGYAATADREHLILRARERGITPIPASNAVWKAEFNIDVPLNSRFSAKESTYICTEKMADRTYRLVCEQKGSSGNIQKGELISIEYIDGYDTGKLIELLIPARDEEKTEALRERYLSAIRETRAAGGNRAYYKQTMHEIAGVGACKIYRATREERKIHIYFLNNLYQIPSNSLAEEVQEIVDPIGKQGEGEGKALLFHMVDIHPCIQELIEIDTEIVTGANCIWEDIVSGIQERIDQYFLELAKIWESEEYLTVRLLRVNEAIAGGEGIVDVRYTTLNGKSENVVLGPNAIPVRGRLSCSQL